MTAACWHRRGDRTRTPVTRPRRRQVLPGARCLSDGCGHGTPVPALGPGSRPGPQTPARTQNAARRPGAGSGSCFTRCRASAYRCRRPVIGQADRDPPSQGGHAGQGPAVVLGRVRLRVAPDSDLPAGRFQPLLRIPESSAPLPAGGREPQTPSRVGVATAHSAPPTPTPLPRGSSVISVTVPAAAAERAGHPQGLSAHGGRGSLLPHQL